MILRGKEKRSDEEILELEKQKDPGSGFPVRRGLRGYCS